jgi:hypothetical protein
MSRLRACWVTQALVGWAVTKTRSWPPSCRARRRRAYAGPQVPRASDMAGGPTCQERDWLSRTNRVKIRRWIAPADVQDEIAGSKRRRRLSTRTG